MIGSGKDLLTWIETNLPALDEDRFEPWHAEPASPTALCAYIHVRIHSPGIGDRVTTVALSAAPITDLPKSPRVPRDVAAAQPDSR